MKGISLEDLGFDVFHLKHYLILGIVLFCIGLVGVLLNRRNIITVLMSIELMLLSANINFVAFSAYNGGSGIYDVDGQVASMLVLAIAAAEAAVGLSILVAFFRNAHSASLDDAQLLKK